MYRKLAIATLLSGGAACAGFLWIQDGAKPVTEIVTREMLTVTVVAPQAQTLVARGGATGTLVPREEIAVMAEVANVRILNVTADVGDRVRKGDALATLDTEGLRLQLAQMEADYAKARDEATRVLSIKDTGAVSESLIMEKRSALATMTARLAEARLAVRRAVVRAPETGVIFERRALIGGLTTGGEPLFRIARHGEIEAELRVPEGDAGRVSPARPVRLSIPGVTSELSGSVRLVSPRIDASDRSAAVRVSIPGYQAPGYQGMMVGSFVHGDINLDAVTALAVPATAVQRDGDGAFLWVVDGDGRVARHPVIPLLQQDGLALIAGATPDLRVVARAGSLLRTGDFVKIVEAR